jgi:hypothetical protein
MEPVEVVRLVGVRFVGSPEVDLVGHARVASCRAVAGVRCRRGCRRTGQRPGGCRCPRPGRGASGAVDRARSHPAFLRRPGLDGLGRRLLRQRHGQVVLRHLKTELVYTRAWPSRHELEMEVFSHIEGFYNPRRRHSRLGNVSPDTYEKIHRESPKTSRCPACRGHFNGAAGSAEADRRTVPDLAGFLRDGTGRCARGTIRRRLGTTISSRRRSWRSAYGHSPDPNPAADDGAADPHGVFGAHAEVFQAWMEQTWSASTALNRSTSVCCSSSAGCRATSRSSIAIRFTGRGRRRRRPGRCRC